MKAAAVLIGGGAYALSFRPHGRSIWQLKCPRPAGIGHPWQKKKKKKQKKQRKRKKRLCPGVSRGGEDGMGAAGIA